MYGVLDESDAKESKEVTEGGNKSGIPGAEQLERVYNHRADGAVTLNGSALTSNKLASSVTVNYPLRLVSGRSTKVSATAIFIVYLLEK